ncbi:MAG: hypothetical protein VR72_11170 [Clostridiaceae bacterium BRH_c20a]|nr:MAG: hypothetical protein VR72_11170 [Clostridiaceae bacterium BRH_c20a]
MSDQLYEIVKSSVNIEDLKRLTLDLVSRPSTQTDKMEYDPEIKSFISDTLMPELKKRGLNSVELDDMGNLICRVGNTDGKKKVFFLGYAMTHPASSMKDPFTGEIVEEAGKEALRGRGVSEQKGSLAAMIAAVELINKNDHLLNGELIFGVSLAGETGRHLAVDNMCKFADIKADLGVVGIGTNNKISQGNKGRADVEVIVYGKSCHSSSPIEGINAIEGACAVIEKLKEMKFTSKHAHLGKPTLASTAIKSYPNATHTIQNECHIIFDRRLLPGDQAADAVKEIREAIGEIPPYKVEVKLGPVTLPSEVKDNSIIITRLSDAIKTVTGKEAEKFYSNSAIDAGYLNKQNIPAVMFGPGSMDYWHTDNEVLFVEDLLKGTYIYSYLALKHLAK